MMSAAPLTGFGCEPALIYGIHSSWGQDIPSSFVLVKVAGIVVEAGCLVFSLRSD